QALSAALPRRGGPSLSVLPRGEDRPGPRNSRGRAGARVCAGRRGGDLRGACPRRDPGAPGRGRSHLTPRLRPRAALRIGVRRGHRHRQRYAAATLRAPRSRGGPARFGGARPRPRAERGRRLLSYRTPPCPSRPLPRVAREAAWRGRGLGLLVAGLAPWYDVDTGEDLARLMSELEDDAPRPPIHTRRLLLSMGRTFVSGGGV